MTDDNSNNTKYENIIDLMKLSPSLLKHFIIDSNLNVDIVTDWKPPETYGLQNSSQIIPQYYLNNNKNMIDIDYYKIIIDYIRNIRKLNEYQINFIKDLDNEHKMELFIEFNKLFDVIQCLL